MNRADELLFKGDIEKAIEQYDAAAKSRPSMDPYLWQRGIAYYYAGRFEEGVAQFERHKNVNPHDVENAAWHFLCKARATSVAEARRMFIPVQGDPRLPMKEVHQLFAGTLGPAAVISAAAGQPRPLSFAHQYVGLYYESLGRPDAAQHHMALATETYTTPSYMGKIAQLHLRRMKAQRDASNRSKGQPYAILRAGLKNAGIAFENTKAGRVAFMGGSITQADGWRQRVYNHLETRFPETRFEYVTAGISSTGSTTGAFRLGTDVLSKGKIDLLFVEFAVNDNQDAALSTTAAIRGMEGIVRQLRRHNPAADMIFTYFPNSSHLKDYESGILPDEIMSHERVAEFYQIPSIHLAREVAEAGRAGTYTFEDYGGVHPKAYGQKVYAARVGALFEKAWPGGSDKSGESGESTGAVKTTAHPMPKERVNALSYVAGRCLDRSAITMGQWTLGVPQWTEKPGNLRALFANREMLHCETPGAPLKASFTGTAIGAYVLAGPDAGVLEFSIDGGAFQSVDLYHRHSKGLHYPRTVMFDAELIDGRHEIVLRLAGRSGRNLTGPAARILQLVVN
jgi:tetratricopeptide (TPR) repeat protein